ncbi:hypothetical protein D210916BOD24_18980 [Alteromonas sp. D210916BOD_24]|uniref:ribose-phosphate pyrophosphokinase n=1 Tax=Alteromonas sp. D210916BOD_24 TaxID=3157618 RepID=UPI00399D0EA7
MKTNTHYFAAVLSCWLLLSGCSGDGETANNTETKDQSAPVQAKDTTHPLAKESENALGVVGKAKEVKHVKSTGTIIYKELEGGFYAFVSNDGERYTLHGLNEAYQQNGLIVEIEGIVTPDIITFTQFGTVLQVKNIKVLDASRIIDNAETH